MRALAVLLLLAAMPAHAETFVTYTSRPTDDASSDAARGAADLTRAIRTRSAGAVAKMLGESIAHQGLWFPDGACTKRFAKPGSVSGGELALLARCLAKLELMATTRNSGMTDGWILTFAPGVELEVRFASARVHWMAFSHADDTRPGIPMLTAQAFEALRKTGSVNADALVKSKLAGEIDLARDSASSWIEVCVDAKGNITSATARDPSSASAKEAFEDVARAWTFRPFEHRGTAIPMCSLSLLTFPASRGSLVEVYPVRDTVAAPLARTTKPITVGREDLEPEIVVTRTPGTISPAALERLRIRGWSMIIPDATTKAAIARTGRTLTNITKLCIDAGGAVTTATVTTPSGVGSFDTRVATAMRSWAFKPYLLKGSATPVCALISTTAAP